MNVMDVIKPLLSLCFSLSLRTMFGRGAGGAGKSFDARQKIGANDVRQRLGGGGGGTGKHQHYCINK